MLAIVLWLVLALTFVPGEEENVSQQESRVQETEDDLDEGAPSQVEAAFEEAWALLMQAEAAEETGDLETARAKVALALEVATRAQGAGDDFRLAHLLWELGFLAERTGAPRTAQGAWAWVLAYRERTLPDDDLHLQAVRGNLALSLKRTGDVLGACALEEKVLEICEKTLPDDHPALARALANLAVTKARLDDVSQARVLQERVLEIRERTLPEDNLHLALARRDLALTLKRLGDLRRARALEEKVLEVRERILPEDHPDLASARCGRAWPTAGGIRCRACQADGINAWPQTCPAAARRPSGRSRRAG